MVIVDVVVLVKNGGIGELEEEEEIVFVWWVWRNWWN